MDILEEEATEDIEMMAAITPTDQPYMKTSVFDTYKKRIPWLLLLDVYKRQDHAPHAREEKNKPIQDAPFGIIGIQMCIRDRYNAVEKAYEEGISKAEFMECYRKFTAVVDSKSEQKQIDAAFEKEMCIRDRNYLKLWKSIQ